MPVVLLIREEDDTHSVVLTEKPIIMGRSSSCDVKLSDDKISSRHLAIKLNKSGRVIIKDLESTNGTFLNGAKIDEAYLMTNDQLMIGQVSIWLDETQLNIKERKTHLRSDQAPQVKFINLQGDGTQSTNDSPPQAEADHESEQDTGSHGSAKEALKERIIKKSQEKKVDPDLGVAINKNEGQFDLEESSGITKIISIQKKQGKKVQKKVSIAPKSKPVEKKQGLLGKIKQILNLD
jgi:pSer/pThr/pTyr-binding forkhead associated (FHA) protein